MKNYAIKFVKAGYWVDIFFKNWDINLDFARISDFT
jgi:hypothetical protein